MHMTRLSWQYRQIQPKIDRYGQAAWEGQTGMEMGMIQPDCTWSQMKQEGLGEVGYTPPSLLLNLSV